MSGACATAQNLYKINDSNARLLDASNVALTIETLLTIIAFGEKDKCVAFEIITLDAH